MKFFIPTEIINEKHCVSTHGEIFRQLGEKCLIVTGRHSSKRNGSLQDATQALEKNGVQYLIFSDIEENPSVETVMKAAQIGIHEKVDFVIGIGGGSPMDAAKAIALMIKHPDKEADFLYQKPDEGLASKNALLNINQALPVVAIPTTAGTGSEATPYAILTLHQEQTKKSIAHLIFPVVALVDASYLSFANNDILINTAIDALAHLIESRLNTNTTLYNQLLSEQGLRIWKKAKNALLTQDFTDEDYETLMNASTIAGMAISHTGTSLPHGLSYALTYHLHIPHGKAVGIFLPGYLELYRKHESQGLDTVASLLNLLDFSDIEEFRHFITFLLGTVSLDKTFMKENVQSLIGNKAKLKNYPFPIREDELAGLI